VRNHFAEKLLNLARRFVGWKRRNHMSNNKIKIFLTAMVLGLVGVTAASAQFDFGTKLKVTIPNEFVVEDKLFPAGEYTIEPTSSITDSSSILVIRGGKHSMIFSTIPTESAKAAESTQLVFNVIDGTRFLSKISFAGETTGSEIPKSKSERRLIAEQKKMEQVVVPANTGL